MTDMRALRAIQAADPDGGETEPTDGDYARHEAWARDTFGPATWETYQAGGWADTVSAMEDPGRTADYL